MNLETKGTLKLIFDFPNGDLYPSKTGNLVNETTDKSFVFEPADKMIVPIELNNSDSNSQKYSIGFDKSLDYITVFDQSLFTQHMDQIDGQDTTV